MQDVVCQIEDSILSGDYKPGDKLPSTRELEKIFKVSSSTIREGVAILEQKGLIESRKGAWGGFFIREINHHLMTESLETLMRHLKLTPQELFEFRATIEAGLIRLVVKRASDQQIRSFLCYSDKFKACLNRGETGWHELIRKESALRKEFLQVIKNRTYAAVLLPIHRNIIKYADFHITGNNEDIRIACEYWNKILPAIAERKEDLAAEQTKQMIQYFMNALLDNTKK